MPSFSLVGALEFRRVVSSLQRDAAASTLSHFESPLTPYASYRRSLHGTVSGSRTPRSRTPLRSPSAAHEQDPWDAALGVPLDERSPPQIVPRELTPIPSIARTPASPTVADSPTDTDAESQAYVPVSPSRRSRAVDVIGHVGHILFPTLHNFWSKSLLGKLAAIFAAPAVMALTLTLPVVVTAHVAPGESEKKHSHSQNGHSASASEGRLIDFEEEGVERALIAEDEVEEEMHELQFNKWLMAMQCCLGALFCAVVLLSTSHKAYQ